MSAPNRTQPMTATEVLQAPRLLALEAREAGYKARIQALEAALKPFAYTGWIIAHMHPEREYEIVLSSEDFKRARDLLQPKDTAK